MRFTPNIHVEATVTLDDIVEQLDSDEQQALMTKLCGTAVPLGFGDGDCARAETIIERAYLAARQLPYIPRELADLFYLVHGRALP